MACNLLKKKQQQQHKKNPLFNNFQPSCGRPSGATTGIVEYIQKKRALLRTKRSQWVSAEEVTALRNYITKMNYNERVLYTMTLLVSQI